MDLPRGHLDRVVVEQCLDDATLRPADARLSFNQERANSAHKIFLGGSMLYKRDHLVGPTRGVVDR
jgi:hypothetical protein